MTGIVLLFFPILMAFAAFSDLLTMRISNWLVLTLAAAFVLVALIAGIPATGIAIHIAVALVVLAVTFGLFAAGWIGGGDAKFAAATALWMGPALVMTYLLYAALLGGALTLALLLARRFPLPITLMQVGWIERLHNHKTGIPYGIALAGAGLLVYPDIGIFLQLAS